MDDDGSGWNEVLVGGWSDEVRRAVVDLVGGLTVGWRGPLVRTLSDEIGADRGWTETLHRVVLDAIGQVTGADLEALGSQAAWACYEDAWSALQQVWGDGGDLATVPLGQELAVTELLAELPPAVAAAAGADVRGPRADPLWVAGRLRIDVDALHRALTRGGMAGADEVRVETVLDRVAGRRR
ncbi:MAG: hypothetical protein WEB03_05015 [Nitriliruptor sp.]|uniref:hypothetical protein n=1 Tax=Nitriliruptor sp. TaxID=2448056 RepID=UPI00349FD39F